MPLIPFTSERDERRLIVILYFGTLALLLILLYATVTNMRRYTDSVNEIRTYNLAQIELNSLLSSLQDQETATRGFLLTNDTAYLQPSVGARVRNADHFSQVDSLLEGDGWHAQLGLLQVRCEEVGDLLAELAGDTSSPAPNATVIQQRLARSKAAMDEVRMLHSRLLSQIEKERESRMTTEVREGLDAPVMLILYSALAIAPFPCATRNGEFQTTAPGESSGTRT